MSAYLSAVVADSPRHYWRCADPGGALLNDIGSAPLALALQGEGPELAYSGPVSDGGSAVITNNVGFDYLDTEVLAVPLSAELWIFQFYRQGLIQSPLDVEDPSGLTLATVQILANGQIQAFTANPPLLSVATLPTQGWHHIVVTSSLAGAVLYLDGVSVATSAAAVPTSTGVLYGVGARANPTNRFPCAAAIAEVAVYSTALSSARVAAHFAAADNTGQPPVSKQFGSFSSGGGIVLNASQLASILGAVRKTFPTT